MTVLDGRKSGELPGKKEEAKRRLSEIMKKHNKVATTSAFLVAEFPNSIVLSLGQFLNWRSDPVPLRVGDPPLFETQLTAVRM